MFKFSESKRLTIYVIVGFIGSILLFYYGSVYVCVHYVSTQGIILTKNCYSTGNIRGYGCDYEYSFNITNLICHGADINDVLIYDVGQEVRVRYLENNNECPSKSYLDSDFNSNNLKYIGIIMLVLGSIILIVILVICSCGFTRFQNSNDNRVTLNLLRVTNPINPQQAL